MELDLEGKGVCPPGSAGCTGMGCSSWSECRGKQLQEAIPELSKLSDGVLCFFRGIASRPVWVSHPYDSWTLDVAMVKKDTWYKTVMEVCK